MTDAIVTRKAPPMHYRRQDNALLEDEARAVIRHAEIVARWDRQSVSIDDAAFVFRHEAAMALARASRRLSGDQIDALTEAMAIITDSRIAGYARHCSLAGRIAALEARAKPRHRVKAGRG